MVNVIIQVDRVYGDYRNYELSYITYESGACSLGQVNVQGLGYDKGLYNGVMRRSGQVRDGLVACG